MFIENEVEEATTQKKPQFKASKHAHLYDVFDINVYPEYAKNKQLLRAIECGGLRSVYASCGDFIQCILWLDNCDCIYHGLEELIDELEELDRTGEQPLDAYGEASIERYKLQLALISQLGDFMANNDLDFIFI